MKKTRQPSLVTISIITTITIVSWVLFSVYEAIVNTQPNPISEEILLPIDPQLDISTLKNIEKRTYFDNNQIQKFQIPKPTSFDTANTLETLNESEQTQESTNSASPTTLPNKTPTPTTTPSP